jgi:Tetratricopeptide repeat
VSHIHACLRVYDCQDEGFDDDITQKWSVIALVLGENESTQDAVRLTEQVVALHKSKLGEHHPDTLTSIHSLAIRYSEAGRRDEALQLTEQMVALRKSKLGEHHPDTLNSIKLITYILDRTGEDTQTSEIAHHKRHGLSRLWQKLRT